MLDEHIGFAVLKQGRCALTLPLSMECGPSMYYTYYNSSKKLKCCSINRVGSYPPSALFRPEPKRTMQTLQIGNDWITDRPGGLNRYYGEMLAHLPEHGIQVHGMVLGREDIARSTEGVVSPFALASDHILLRLRAARRAALRSIRANNIDLVAVHFALYGFPIADKLSKIPTVVHFQGPWASESKVEGRSSISHRLKVAIENSVYHRANRLLVLSSAFKGELLQRYGVSEELIRVIPAGVNGHRFNTSQSREEARNRLGWPQNRRIILAVRRQVRRMGLENLIDATKELVRTHGDILVLLGGSGPITQELKKRISEYGLEENVMLLGRIDDADLPSAYRAANMTVIPTQALEGFGLISLESLASGTPAFVTPIGGLPETIMPFAPQCVFEDASTGAMIARLDEVLKGSISIPSDEDSNSYAMRNFGWSVIAGRLAEVYREALR